MEEEYYFHIPGQDLIMRRVAPETGGLREPDSVQAKLSADIARHLGCRRNANECFGVCGRENVPWYFKGYDMKWYINWLGIRGVNLFVPHAFYYSMAGQRKEERPPDVGPHNIWWPHYRLFSDYMKRISCLMTDAVSLAKVAVLCDNNLVPAGDVAELYEHQIDFHYLPAALLKDCTVRENKLCIGTCRFEVVVDLYGFRTQEAYAEYLSKVNTVDQADAEKLYDYRTVVTDGRQPNLRAVHMEKEDVSWYLFSNEGEETIETEVFIKGLHEGQKLFWVDLWNVCGESCSSRAGDSAGQDIMPEDSTGIHLTLAHCEMKLLLLLDKNMEYLVSKYWQETGISKTMDGVFLGDWTIRFKPIQIDGIFASGNGNEGKNTVTYQCVYTVPDEKSFTGKEYFTVRGEEMAECVCNGIPAGVSFYGPHIFRIGHLLKAGKNEVCLRFTGNAANLYGDVKIPFGLDCQ